MTYPEGGFHRAPRPLIGWGGVLLIVCCLVFLFLLSIPVLRAVNRWADGQPVDFTGFAAVIGAALPALGAIASFVSRWMTSRSWERTEQIRAGVAPAGPFVPSPPSATPPDEPLVNPHGGPGAP